MIVAHQKHCTEMHIGVDRTAVSLILGSWPLLMPRQAMHFRFESKNFSV